MDLATRVRQLRITRFLSQADLAAKSGVSKPTIKRIEGGGVLPHPRTVRQLAEALGVEPSELIAPEELQGKRVAA